MMNEVKGKLNELEGPAGCGSSSKRGWAEQYACECSLPPLAITLHPYASGIAGWCATGWEEAG